jgi:ribonuclease R
LGPNFVIDDDGLLAHAARSGDVIGLGDRMLVTVTDAAILRRTVYGRRVFGEAGEQPTHRKEPKRDKRKKAKESHDTKTFRKGKHKPEADRKKGKTKKIKRAHKGHKGRKKR